MGRTLQLRIKKVTYPLMAIDLHSVCIVVTMYDAIIADIPKLSADASAALSFVQLKNCVRNKPSELMIVPAIFGIKIFP